MDVYPSHTSLFSCSTRVFKTIIFWLKHVKTTFKNLSVAQNTSNHNFCSLIICICVSQLRLEFSLEFSLQTVQITPKSGVQIRPQVIKHGDRKSPITHDIPIKTYSNLHIHPGCPIFSHDFPTEEIIRSRLRWIQAPFQGATHAKRLVGVVTWPKDLENGGSPTW